MIVCFLLSDNDETTDEEDSSSGDADIDKPEPITPAEPEPITTAAQPPPSETAEPKNIKSEPMETQTTVTKPTPNGETKP